ncbi:GH25 family lysozyme [Acetilactobacillus jinshanensis]|uniref:GH25 family lysozyme n=1 Tax=Acetilactobacillus jinshanensis TaxID=1720083 RepID=UPI0021501FC9|nr:GH25 family lysozyme [Acetilactobacillus jinshanensis]
MRATQGSIYTDNDFDNNYQRAEGSSLDIGVYHVFSFASHPQDQFKNFKDQIATRVGSLPIAVQVSSKRPLTKSRIASLKVFVNDVKRHYHQPVIIWTSRPIANQLKLGHVWINNSPSPQEWLMVLNPKETLNLNGQDNNVTQFVFNGNHRNWREFSDLNHIN